MDYFLCNETLNIRY